MKSSLALSLLALLSLTGCNALNTQPATESHIEGQWSLQQFYLQGSLVELGERTRLQIMAEDEHSGRLSGNAGCNGFFGAYRVDNGKFSTGPIGATMMACPDDLMTQEQQFLKALEQLTSFSYDGQTLKLQDESGQVKILMAPE
ncbi:META domain-containing protein [Aestuariirhabdus sp. Z084]|uniref:META domain-containing protein n=1 Tax=Aestuariirhabdus haliotis TaxID=2918751 RepID=UPI00201B3E71|nr:META domain-containing protein [Aestuariirhabdus haliotis]MCL6417305.1 META domain-containing protein [Aestuariirhabdus haliotis]MCL6421250.1 META domain-containing protein [Aestuariirhabdus haliotis]